MARVTLQTIADEVGVSRMTVSNAFSRPDQLSVELRERILAAADALGYVGPDPAARALARGTTGAVGVLLTDSLRYAFTDTIATGFLAAFTEQLAPTGFAVTLLTTSSGDGDRVVAARDVAIDGALVYACEFESPARDWLLRRGLPLVFVDQPPVRGITSINIDDRSGAQAAAQHVVDLGHHHIGLIMTAVTGGGGRVDDVIAAAEGHPQRERALGWNDVLVPARARVTAVKAARNSERDAMAAARLLLSSDDRPTAVLCFSDVIAFATLRVTAELGLAVPRDVSVVGFDDSPVARYANPRVTTVAQDVAAKGALAATALTTAIEQARAGHKARARHHVLPTSLVVRESTAPPPARRRPR